MAKKYDGCVDQNCEICEEMERKEMKAKADTTDKAIAAGSKVRVTFEAEYTRFSENLYDGNYSSHVLNKDGLVYAVPRDATVTVLAKPKPSEPPVGTVIKVAGVTWVRLANDKKWHVLGSYSGTGVIACTWDDIHQAYPQELTNFETVTKL